MLNIMNEYNDMVNIREVEDEYNNVVGLRFKYSEKVERRFCDIDNKYCDIFVSYGEIKGAETSNYWGVHNIYDYDDPNWSIVEDVLCIFLEKAPKEFDLIVGKLNRNSMGYKIAEKIIDGKINKLEEQVKSLKLMKRRY